VEILSTTVRHRDLYVTTRNSGKREISMPRRDLNRQYQQAIGHSHSP
jgi:hypothetical protein